MSEAIELIIILVGYVGWYFAYFFWKEFHKLNSVSIKSDYLHHREMELMQEMYEEMRCLYEHDIATRDEVIEKHNLKIFYGIKEEKEG